MDEEGDDFMPYKSSTRSVVPNDSLDLNQAKTIRDYPQLSTWVYYDRAEMFLPTRLTLLPGRGIPGGSARNPKTQPVVMQRRRKGKKMEEPKAYGVLAADYASPKLFRLDGKYWGSVTQYLNWKRTEIEALGMTWDALSFALEVRATNAKAYQNPEILQALEEYFAFTDAAEIPKVLTQTWAVMSIKRPARRQRKH